MPDVELRPLGEADIDSHNAGEDEAVVRWLSGEPATVESTRHHFAHLAQNAARGAGKRGFGIWWEGRLAGYVDCDPDSEHTPAPGDVNIAYAVHPWARGRGVATAAVAAICAYITAERIGRRAIILADARNIASARVAMRSGFDQIGVCAPSGEYNEDGTPVELSVYALELRR
ncbi:GNAT family N-acetyltransferase [Fodinicola acaciae]|uniref:GNAT family N-acetyltransferase n=1 Tax=Fodinicola acaciae TaxID=2681555 RepID=UPI0013D0F8AD|nr:GNAT family N-acetyltransferase [Fodinicola acaciae]